MWLIKQRNSIIKFYIDQQPEWACDTEVTNKVMLKDVGLPYIVREKGKSR